MYSVNKEQIAYYNLDRYKEHRLVQNLFV